MTLSDLLGDHGPEALPLPGSAHGLLVDLLQYAKRGFIRRGWSPPELNVELN